MFNGMQYGDADSTRDANSINMLNINLAYDFTIVPANIPTSNGALTARVMLVYDKQANSALYSTQDLLQTSGSASINYLAPKNLIILNDSKYYMIVDISCILVRMLEVVQR